jgi:hypothetical protein
VSISAVPVRRAGETHQKEDVMYVSTLSQMAYLTDRQRRQMEERLGRLASARRHRRESRRRRGFRVRPARS